MKYMGSKNRYAKDILPIILRDRKSNQHYVEPFAGGMNLIQYVDNPRTANDIHFYLIALFRALQIGYIPPDNVSQHEYYHVKYNIEKYPDYFVGFVGFCCSYAGKWWGGYARGNNGDRVRNYALESKNNLLKQIKRLKGCNFLNYDYQLLPIPENSIIYCDIEYKDTTKYSNPKKAKFNHDVFWDWARIKHSEGHSIYISEYTAPNDAVLLWEKSVNSSLTKNTGQKKGIERLWTFPQ